VRPLLLFLDLIGFGVFEVLRRLGTCGWNKRMTETPVRVAWKAFYQFVFNVKASAEVRCHWFKKILESS
jgi:hypothetical protein